MPFRPALQTVSHQLTDDTMGFPKGDALFYQVIGQLGSQEKARSHGFREHVAADAKPPHQLSVDRQRL